MTLAAEVPVGSSSRWRGLDPRWGIVGLSAWSAACSMVTQVPTALVALAGSLALLAASNLPLAWVGRRLLTLSPFLILFIVPLLIIHGASGLWAALLLVVKSLAIAMPIIVMIGTFTLTETCDALATLFVPRRLISLFLMSERSGTLTASTFNRLRRAMCVRGFRWQANRQTYATVAGAVGATTIRGFDQSRRLGQALACRGYTGQYRPWKQYATSAWDIGFFAICAAAGSGLAAWDWWYRR